MPEKMPRDAIFSIRVVGERMTVMQLIVIGKPLGADSANFCADRQGVGIALMLLGYQGRVLRDCSNGLTAQTATNVQRFGSQRIILAVQINIIGLLVFKINQ